MAQPADNMVLASSVKPFWTPKGKPCATMCATCPFGPGAHRLNDAAEAVASAKQAAGAGLDFHCHGTVYNDALKPGKRPTMKPKSEWRVCAGAIAYKQNLEVTHRRALLKSQGRLIDDLELTA